MNESTRPTADAATGDAVVAVPADNGGRDAALARGRALTSLFLRNGAVVALVVVLVLGVIIVPTFGSADNFRNVALAASFIAIISAGMTFVIISGGIDLSVGSVFALGGVLAGWGTLHGGTWVAISLPLVVGSAFGPSSAPRTMDIVMIAISTTTAMNESFATA